MKAWTSGNVAGTGTFRCTDCDYPVSLDAVDELPTCPNCGGTEFVRASLFTTAQTSVVADFAPETDDPAWLEEIRDGLTDPGQYLAFRTDDRDVVAYALEREWTRIGRSLAADIRFDDPTVSRRHALIVRQPDGLRVLAVDLDPQGNLSDYLDVDPDVSPTIGDVLADRASPADAVHDGIIPANLGLAEAELILGGRMGRELALKKALRELQGDYDVILVDCPPSLGLLTVNALVASGYALLSAEAQYFAMQGVEQALEVIELARDNLNPELESLGIILNIADMRTRHSREAFDSLRQHFGDKLIDTTIRASIAYAESAERAQSILDYRPDLAVDYLKVADELLSRLGLEPPRRRLAALTGSLAPASA